MRLRIKLPQISLYQFAFFLYMCALCAHQTESEFDNLLIRVSFFLLIGVEGIHLVTARRVQAVHLHMVLWYMVFLSYHVASTFWALNSADAWNRSFVYSSVMILALLFVLADHINTKEDVLWHMKALLFAVLYMSVYALIRTPALLTGLFRLGFEIGINPNTMGIHTVIGTALALYFAQQRKVYYLCALFLGMITLLTGSRTAFGGVVIVFAVFMMLSSAITAKMIRNMILVVLVLMIVLVLSMHVELLYNIIGNRIENAFQALMGGYGDDSVDTREFFRGYAMRMFAARPFFGHGASGFKSAMRIIRYQLVAYSHCNYTELLANLGITGFLVYYCFSGSIFLGGIRNYSKSRRDRKEMTFLLSVMVAAAFIDYYAVTYDSIFVQVMTGLLFMLNVFCESGSRFCGKADWNKT